MDLRRISLVLLLFILTLLTFSRNIFWKDALHLWSDVMKKSPLKIRPCINLGGAYIHANDLQMAKDTFLRCAELINRKVMEEGVVYYLIAQIEVYLNLAAIYGNQGNIDMAMEFLRKAYDVDPELPKTNYAIAFAYMEKNDLDSAEPYLLKAISIAEDAKAYFLYGELKEKKGLYDEALELYRRAVELDPKNSLYRVRLGYIYKIKNMPESAEIEWQRATGIDPLNVEAYVNLGSLYYENGLIRKAYTYYRKALEIKPDSIEALLGAGNAVDEMGNHPLAIEYYERALQIDPQNPLIYENLAIALKRMGDFGSARDAMNKARELKRR